MQDRSFGVYPCPMKLKAVVDGLGAIRLCRPRRRLDLVDPVFTVDVVQACGAEVDRCAPAVGGFVDRLAELYPRAEVLRPDPPRVQPQLPVAVVQVLDVYATDVVFVHHRTSPGW